MFALDIYQGQLDGAKERIEQAGLNNMTFILGDITSISPASIPLADAVYCRLIKSIK